MRSPEKKVLDELEDFLEEGLESSGAGRMVYEDVIEKLEELKYEASREYNLVVA